ncbi:uncharacterized protein LOC144656448 [Oculina patagonica]
MANEKKEEVLQHLENEEFAVEKLDDLWRDKIDTTGVTTVRELFARFEQEKGPLSLDDLKDLLRDLAYVDITRKVFPQKSPQNSASTGKFRIVFEFIYLYLYSIVFADSLRCCRHPPSPALKHTTHNFCKRSACQSLFSSYNSSYNVSLTVPEKYIFVEDELFNNDRSIPGQSLLSNASVTGGLEATGRNNAATGFQPSPAGTMVTGRERLPPKQPSSHNDWSPENACGTIDNSQQKLRKYIDRLKVRVQELEQELETEKARSAQCQGQCRHLQQVLVAKDSDQAILVEQLNKSHETVAEERQVRKILEESLENEQQQKNHLEERVMELEQQLDLERIRHDSTKKELTRESELRHGHEQTMKQVEMCVLQERANVQQEKANFEQQCIQHVQQQVQQIQRVAEENCARHQQPEPRSWIIQRNQIVLSDNVLGRGSYGNVCKGTFRGSPVAVKQLHNLILSFHNRGLFEREMEIASRCRHPNLLQFIGATSGDENPLFVTELLDCNLRDLLNERSLNSQEIQSIALDVASGLNYLHCNQPPIVHRDIKSDNILLKRQNDSWIAKVSDFGAANFLRRVMTPNQGTPIYSAPESGTEQHSQLADVYSFGLLLLEMCTRQRPVPEEISEQIETVANLPLKNFIRACVHQNPENRPSMNEVIHVLTH